MTPIPSTIRAISSRLLAEELVRRGVTVEHLNTFTPGDAFLALRLGAHVEHVYGTRSGRTASTADYACKDKYTAKRFLARAGLCVPRGEMFACADMERIEAYAAELGFPCVLKRHDGSRGELVFVGVNSPEQCRAILERHFADRRFVLVEELCRGREFRFFATRTGTVGVVWREPAGVVGDGQRSVRQLIDDKNAGRAPKFRIKLDELSEELLAGQGLAYESVPASGQPVRLRGNSNASTGGDSRDVTDECHPDFKRLAARAVAAVPDLLYAGVDIMIEQDIHQAPVVGRWAVLEINSNPGISIHHHPGSGQARDVAGAIADLLFPETREN